MCDILSANGIDVHDGYTVGKLCILWKHGFPSRKTKLLSDKVINIFIIRSLDKWLVSMYHKPYCLYTEQCCFKCFLKRNQKISTSKGGPLEMFDIITNKSINKVDENKTIFEIRYLKIKSYLRYLHNNSDVVFVSLDYLQNKDNCRAFIHRLNEKYELGIDGNNIIDELEHHVKTQIKGCKETPYDYIINEEESLLINRFKNDDLEDWINNLTFEMY